MKVDRMAQDRVTCFGMLPDRVLSLGMLPDRVSSYVSSRGFCNGS